MAKVLIVVALTISVGGHWALLQGLAWGTMLVRYSRTMPLAKAVQYTFDGEHPCHLCKAVKQGRAQEQQQEKQNAKSGLKLDPCLVWQSTDFDFGHSASVPAADDTSAQTRGFAPPKPRPRCPSLDSLV